ncbi:hypothetical protein KUL97_01310 [Synechococcus sp. HK05]|uniref:hypothetical protein n=1 Tax=Synechococcus sp. HK05 TaxID=2725975 RepID=UPI001C38F92B|nr:hypothetical protein [Synechococcus sp. HK05]MBV2350340.1 hypothetical protein [Synechococcus sp. HK05]
MAFHINPDVIDASKLLDGLAVITWQYLHLDGLVAKAILQLGGAKIANTRQMQWHHAHVTGQRQRER